MTSRRVLSFPKAEQKQSPAQLIEVVRHTYNPRQTIYVSGALTSGNAKRLGPVMNSRLSPDEKLKISFKYNCWIFDEVAKEIEKIVDESEVLIVPPYLGIRPGWSELEYNLFWFFMITGIDQKLAYLVEEHIVTTDHIQRHIFRDHHADYSQRKIEYRKFLHLLMAFIREAPSELHPLERMILLPDHHLSLGGSLEKAIAQSTHIPVYELYFNVKNPRFKRSIASNSVWETIRRIDSTFHFPIVDLHDTSQLAILQEYHTS